MAAHYEKFRLNDPAIIPRIVARWPFATIITNGPDWPVTAQAPVVMAKSAPDAIEFHLAKSNPALSVLGPAAKAGLVLQGPSAHVSPSWYKGRFPGPEADRSRTAPTWDYLTLTLRGHLKAMSDQELAEHLIQLVALHEADDGWHMAEMDPLFSAELRRHILGFRLVIEGFDCVAKFSQDREAEDIAGIIDGLCGRDHGQDREVAALVRDLGPVTGHG